MHVGCVSFKQNFQTRSPKTLWSRTVRKLEMVDVGSFRPQGTPYNGLYGEGSPPERGTFSVKNGIYKVRGWTLWGESLPVYNFVASPPEFR